MHTTANALQRKQILHITHLVMMQTIDLSSKSENNINYETHKNASATNTTGGVRLESNKCTPWAHRGRGARGGCPDPGECRAHSGPGAHSREESSGPAPRTHPAAISGSCTGWRGKAPQRPSRASSPRSSTAVTAPPTVNQSRLCSSVSFRSMAADGGERRRMAAVNACPRTRSRAAALPGTCAPSRPPPGPAPGAPGWHLPSLRRQFTWSCEPNSSKPTPKIY